MMPRICILLAAFSLLVIGACSPQPRSKPPAEPKPGVLTQIKPPKAPVEDPPPSEVKKAPIPSEPIPAEPIRVEEPPGQKSDDKTPRPIELGRSSIAQSEEPKIRTPDLHGWDPLGADCAWFREFKRDVSGDEVDPNSDKMLSRLVKGKGHIDPQWSGSWTPADWHWHTIPFQIVSGNTEPLSIPGNWAYSPKSNGPFMLPPEPVVHENSKHTRYATEKWKSDGDHHLIVYVRDEKTGGFKELWEYYQPWVQWNDKKIAAIHGASWRKFDLQKGETPAPGVLSTDAAGLMFMPLVVRYDEVARGSIDHALRFCVNNADIAPTFKWPARTAARAHNVETGMPYGTRLRIKDSWWKENADKVLGVKTQARVIGEALRRYGCVLADGSGGTSVQLCGVADKRWERELHARLKSIPVSALEVVATPPLLEIKGPTTLAVGETGKWTFKFNPDDTPVGEGSNINLYDSKNKLLKYQFAIIDSDHRTATAEYRFTEPGVYTIKPYREWNTGLGPFRITVEAKR
jgi:hypothetical protein